MTDSKQHPPQKKKPSKFVKWRRRMEKRLREPHVFKPLCILFAVAVFAGVVGSLILFLTNPSGSGGGTISAVPGSGDNEDEAPMLFRLADEFLVGGETVEALDVDSLGRIYVGGDRILMEVDEMGTPLNQFSTQDDILCVKAAPVAGDVSERLYVGTLGGVEVIDPESGDRIADWPAPEAGSRISSIAVGPTTVFAADAGNKVVYRYDLDGELLGEIRERPDDPGDSKVFAVFQSRRISLVVTPDDGLLRAANPGLHRIEAYTQDGQWEQALTWGKSSSTDPAGFVGCCNPIDLDLLPDGRFITTEKVFVRVKVYDSEGEFLGLVADETTLLTQDEQTPPSSPEMPTEVGRVTFLRVAADPMGRVFVLNPDRRAIRVFEEIDSVEEEADSE